MRIRMIITETNTGIWFYLRKSIGPFSSCIYQRQNFVSLFLCTVSRITHRHYSLDLQDCTLYNIRDRLVRLDK